ncbi:MAG: HAD family phosphatase [Candidatus Omnitrophica bacterium]|nr:HAD family phosphatase [Candidatus Omnitrophota bacterium]MCM8783306.1 HAD family phosphatase [Candidatus Omnitrophota bacterium]
MKIKTIIFDLGNVLIRFSHSIAAKKLTQYSPYSHEEIHNLIFDSNIVSRYETGKIKTKDFFFRLKKLLKLNIGYLELRRIWNEIFFANPPVELIVKKLKGRYRLILLSNINYSHFAYIKEKFPVVGEFDRIILSYRVGFRKPHPLIYKKAIEVSNCLPGEILYIDDRVDLVSAALVLGINALCFRTVGELKKAMGRLGVNSL